MLLVKGLSLVNGKTVNLSLEKGRGYVLEGPNGVGKSVLLRTLAVLYPAPAEEFSFKGTKISSENIEDYRSRVLYCGSATHLPGEMTAEEFLSAPLRLKIYHGFQSHFNTDEYLARWQLSGKKLAVLSSGQRQLLIFLRAMVLRPDVLLLDEPTSHLDREKTREVEGLLSQWKTEERSYLVVSHSEEQSARLGERISFKSLEKKV